MKNKLIKITTGILAFSFLLTGCGKTGKAPEGTVAKVGDSFITINQVKELYDYQAFQYTQGQESDMFDETTESGKEASNKLKEYVLENLVFQEVAVQVAKNRGIKITDEEIKEAIDSMIEQAGGQEVLDAYLEEQNITEEEFRKEQSEYYRMQALITKLDEELQKELAPTEEEIKSRLEKDKDQYLPIYNADHILFSTVDETFQPITDEKKIEVIKAEAEALLTEINSGEISFQDKFDEISEASKGENPLSTESGTKILAETLGDFKAADMVEPFTKAVDEMENDSISTELVQTEFGFHIIRLNNKATSIEEISEEKLKDIYETVKNTILNETVSKHLEEQKEKIKIVYFDANGKEVKDGATAVASFDFSVLFPAEKPSEETDSKETTEETK